MEDAIRLVVENGFASTDLLEKKLLISYNRADALLNEMEKSGIVGPQNGTLPREVFCYNSEKVKVVYGTNVTGLFEDNEAVPHESDDSEILKKLGIKRVDNPVLLKDVILEGAILVEDPTHEIRMGFVDDVVSKTSYEESKIILIDTQCFYSVYKGLNNLMAPVVINNNKMYVLAHWLNHEYADRVKLLTDKCVRSIEHYNSVCEGDSRLPNILVVLYDINVDGDFIDRLEDGVLMNGSVTGIHITAFSNDYKSQGVKTAVKRGFVKKE